MYSVRKQCGMQLAIEELVEADIVSSVPESGTAAAHGYAEQVRSDLYVTPNIINISLL